MEILAKLQQFELRLLAKLFCQTERRAVVPMARALSRSGDGYLHLLPFTQAPIADLWSLNRWIGDEELAHFQRWQAARTQAQKIA